jgi:predicted secreted hydrolase
MKATLLDALQLRASLDQAAYTLDLNANGPLVFHGDEGVFNQIQQWSGKLLLFATLL